MANRQMDGQTQNISNLQDTGNAAVIKSVATYLEIFGMYSLPICMLPRKSLDHLICSHLVFIWEGFTYYLFTREFSTKHNKKMTRKV